MQLPLTSFYVVCCFHSVLLKYLFLSLTDNDFQYYVNDIVGNQFHVFLANMVFGMNTITGEKRFLKSWKSEDDPSTRAVFIWNGSAKHWRSGFWNGLKFNGMVRTYILHNQGNIDSQRWGQFQKKKSGNLPTYTV